MEDWNAKVGSQEIPVVTGKFGLGVQSETGQRLIEFCQENAPSWVIASLNYASPFATTMIHEVVKLTWKTCIFICLIIDL